MLRLMLMRHAKSSWGDPDTEDFDRPLNARGREAAPLVGAWIEKHGLAPAHIICSAARRTRETLAFLLPTLPGTTSIAISPALYTFEMTDLADILSGLRESPSPLMLIGHNPAIHDLALTLADNDGSPIYSVLHHKFPTAALAVIDFDGSDWRAVKPQTGRLVEFIRPRDLVDAE
ncbi:MAG: histidine phosphatase family protein [Hyphomicrobiales bacterium]